MKGWRNQQPTGYGDDLWNVLRKILGVLCSGSRRFCCQNRFGDSEPYFFARVSFQLCIALQTSQGCGELETTHTPYKTGSSRTPCKVSFGTTHDESSRSDHAQTHFAANRGTHQPHDCNAEAVEVLSNA